MSIHHPYPNEERGHTLKWKDGVTPRVLKSKDDVAAALAAGKVEEFAGMVKDLLGPVMAEVLQTK